MYSRMPSTIIPVSFTPLSTTSSTCSPLKITGTSFLRRNVTRAEPSALTAFPPPAVVDGLYTVPPALVKLGSPPM